MRRFLQHVLPRGFHKVRYFGLWHPAQRHNATRVRQMLQLRAPPEPGPPPGLVLSSREYSDTEPMPPIEHQGRLIFIRTLGPHTPRQAMAP
jgi:Putative transposase